MQGAVAVDFGASSGRFAVGRLVDGRIQFEIIHQVAHGPLEEHGALRWDIDALVSLCQDAANYAAAHDCATLGIDAWGVDHGFLDHEGSLLAKPVCYRDLSHVRAFESLTPHRRHLFELTGCQHQPFNTICQLVARRSEDPHLPERATWLILPDLLGYLLTGERNNELTEASTTQLLGLDRTWSSEAFAIAKWPVPDVPPSLPGNLGGEVRQGLRLAHIGSHDTASAVCGFGSLPPGQAFLNVGTWSLFGCVIPTPITSMEAENANFTNERTVDGQVRFLKNIPGFYVIGRLHEELGVAASVPEWLAHRTPIEERVDLLHPELYNPTSMVETCAALAGRRPRSNAEWADLALGSLTRTIASQPGPLGRLTDRRFDTLRVGGGGSQSADFCQSLANESGLEVLAGPAEATVLGNLAMQFKAAGAFASDEEMNEVVARSGDRIRYEPQA